MICAPAYPSPRLLARLQRASLCLVFLAAVAATTSARAETSLVPQPMLSPQPREVHAQQRISVRAVTVTVPGGDSEDFFAAQNLKDALAQAGIAVSPAAEAADLTIALLRGDSPDAAQVLSTEHLRFEAPMHDEGYILVSRPGNVTIIGETAAGVFYGVQTLKQMIEPDPGGALLWTGTVRDWPAMKYRGIDDDLSRGPFPTLAFQKHQLEVFAARKVNVYSPYFENTLQYSADPLASPPGGALSRAEAQDLVAFARRLHIMIVPEQEAFGHLHHILEFEKYTGLSETPHGHVIAPGGDGSQALIKSWFSQIAEDFPGPFLHIGADETFELGTGRTRADVEKRGLGPVYADFLASIHSTLAPLHRRLLFWGDVAGNDPAAVDRLPKDMIAIPWIYWHQDSYDKNILPFKNAGIETWVAPGDANWSLVYPLGSVALDNIAGFVESGQRLGSTGELLTVWNDDGEGLFNQDWFGVLFGAAAAWQPGKSDGAAYQASFGRTFFGDTSGRIDQAQRELMAAEDLIDVSDKAFWLDPWTKQGQEKNAKMRAKIPEARRHAERAIELIETALASDPTLRERPALAAMELGARRIDFIGMKFQMADEMSALYAKAYAMKNDKAHRTETRELLITISSMNGRCQDLRDGYALLKTLYRDSWLAENRPYWLDNVLVRYDLQMQTWQQRGDKISMVIDDWQAGGTLPDAASVGIPAPPQGL